MLKQKSLGGMPLHTAQSQALVYFIAVVARAASPLEDFILAVNVVLRPSGYFSALSTGFSAAASEASHPCTTARNWAGEADVTSEQTERANTVMNSCLYRSLLAECLFAPLNLKTIVGFIAIVARAASPLEDFILAVNVVLRPGATSVLSARASQQQPLRHLIPAQQPETGQVTQASPVSKLKEQTLS